MSSVAPVPVPVPGPNLVEQITKIFGYVVKYEGLAPLIITLVESVEADLASEKADMSGKLVAYAANFKVPPESPIYQALALVDAIKAATKPAG